MDQFISMISVVLAWVCVIVGALSILALLMWLSIEFALRGIINGLKIYKRFVYFIYYYKRFRQYIKENKIEEDAE